MKRRPTGPRSCSSYRGFALGVYTCGVSSHDRHVQEWPSDLLSPAGGSVRDTKVVGVADMVSVSAVRPSREPRPPRCEANRPMARRVYGGFFLGILPKLMARAAPFHFWVGKEVLTEQRSRGDEDIDRRRRKHGGSCTTPPIERRMASYFQGSFLAYHAGLFRGGGG